MILNVEYHRCIDGMKKFDAPYEKIGLFLAFMPIINWQFAVFLGGRRWRVLTRRS